MPVIDFHVHTFPDAIAERAVKKLADISGITPSTDGTVGATLPVLRHARVDTGVSLNIATSPKQMHTINDHAAVLNRELGGRLISFGSVHPDAPDAVEELRRIKQLGLPGIKLHPDYQGFMVDEERLFPIYEMCGELGLPIVFHAGWDCYSPELIHNPPARSARVAKLFPRTRMVLAHLGGLKQWDEVERHLCGLENVYFDTAIIASHIDPAQAVRVMRNHPADHVLLGSDCPWEDPAVSVAFIENLPVSERRKRQILGENAQRLLRQALQ